jgi:hypothetical protein
MRLLYPTGQGHCRISRSRHAYLLPCGTDRIQLTFFLKDTRSESTKDHRPSQISHIQIQGTWPEAVPESSSYRVTEQVGAVEGYHFCQQQYVKSLLRLFLWGEHGLKRTRVSCRAALEAKSEQA